MWAFNIYLFVFLVTCIYCQWESDIFKEFNGKAVFDEEVMVQCSSKVFNISNLKLNVNISDILAHVHPSIHHTLEEYVELKKVESMNNLVAYFNKLCYEKKKRGVGAILKSGGKLLQKGGQFVKANKGTSIFNAVTMGLSAFEIAIAWDTSKKVDRQQLELEKMSAQIQENFNKIQNLTIQMDLITAANIISGKIDGWTSDSRDEFKQLVLHGKLVSRIEDAITPDQTVHRREIELIECSKADSTLVFKYCTSFTETVKILPLVHMLHYGSFSSDGQTFSRVLFNRTSVVINGLYVPILLNGCKSPNLNNFDAKIFVCGKEAVIVNGCTPDATEHCQVETKLVPRDFVDVRTIGQTYLIATLLKSYSIVNGTSGHVEQLSTPTSNVFSLLLPYKSYAVINGKKLQGLANDETSVQYLPANPTLIIKAEGLFTGDRKIVVGDMEMQDSNRDHYPDDKVITVAKPSIFSGTFWFVAGAIASIILSIGSIALCYWLKIKLVRFVLGRRAVPPTHIEMVPPMKIENDRFDF